jgi:hypothetical protein
MGCGVREAWYLGEQPRFPLLVIHGAGLVARVGKRSAV